MHARSSSNRRGSRAEAGDRPVLTHHEELLPGRGCAVEDRRRCEAVFRCLLAGTGVNQFNVVYTQPQTVTAWRETGEFPEGAVFIKELRQGVTAVDGDDKVSSLGALKGWFAMIKPPKANAPQGPLWGDGWGWSSGPAVARS